MWGWCLLRPLRWWHPRPWTGGRCRSARCQGEGNQASDGRGHHHNARGPTSSTFVRNQILTNAADAATSTGAAQIRSVANLLGLLRAPSNRVKVSAYYQSRATLLLQRWVGRCGVAVASVVHLLDSTPNYSHWHPLTIFLDALFFVPCFFMVFIFRTSASAPAKQRAHATLQHYFEG